MVATTENPAEDSDKEKELAADEKPKPENVQEESAEKKSYRKRKKHHYNAIRAQMEFYFGDANLSKDRFLKQLIVNDPYVPLEVFLTFNKIRALTETVEEIAKSLTNSELLELDESLQKVRRKTELPLERNADHKTLYVESLPPTADHDWVRGIFERFGRVAYISLPKYAKSKKIKEFGFVEFEEEGSVAKALKAFKEFGGVLQIEAVDPAELASIKTYVKEQQDLKTNVEGAKPIKKGKKRSAEEVIKEAQFENADVEPQPKKPKVEPEKGATNENESSATDTETTADEDIETETETDKNEQTPGKESETDGTKKKRRKKKKRKTKSEDKLRKDAELDANVSYYELKILPKRSWKSLRNKYLNMQREIARELKRKERGSQHTPKTGHSQMEGEEVVEVAPEAPSSKKSKLSKERRLQGMNMNFYGAGEAPPTAAAALVAAPKQNPALERAPLFSFEPGLIVEVGFLEPCVNVKEFKADMRQYQSVKYVDVKEGAMQAQLRLESAAEAEKFIKQLNCAEYKCKLLTGEAETEYWRKIEKDREMKLNKKVKVPQKRGREKMKKLISKHIHIRFGDDDEET